MARTSNAKNCAEEMTPMAKPIRRPFSVLFPPWRIGSKVRSADEPLIEGLSDECVIAEWAFAGLVVVGIALEFVIAWIGQPHDSPLGHWGTVWADFLIGFGVAGEVIASMIAHTCQSELTRRSNDRLGELEMTAGFAEERAARAAERAAKAELETERLRGQIAPRLLTQKQYDILQTLKGKIPAVRIVSSNSAEAAAFSDRIALALYDAGIAVMLGHPNPGQIWTGTMLWLPDLTDRATNPLIRAFKDAGLHCGNGPIASAGLPPEEHDLPVIAVGDKIVVYESGAASGPSK